jgi:hypothetical protein
VTHPSVEWVLEQVASVVDSVATDYSQADDSDVVVRRIDRDNKRYYDGSGTLDMSTPIRQRAGALERGVYIGAGHVDRSSEPVGTEYDLDVDEIVGVRLEGLTAQNGHGGHVDPEGNWGIPWTEFERRVRGAIYDGRTWPDAGGPNISFTHLTITNEAPQSHQWPAYYRTDWDIVFNGFEDLG